MRHFLTLFCCVVFVANLFVTFVVAQPPKSPVQLAAEKLLREMPVRIYNGKANESDLRECVKFIDIAQNDNARRPFVLLAAQYNRITLNKPERALAIVAPYLIGAERAKSWQKSNDDAVKVVNAKWTKEVATAKREKQDPPKQPPKTERYTDEWTNTKMSRPKAGNLFNRRECSWYISSKQKDAVLWLGLVCFVKEDYNDARMWWEKLAEIDKEFYGKMAAKGMEKATTYSRLMWNLENQQGCLYATPAEMKAFKNKRRRLAVLIADLLYESERPSDAMKIYRILENNVLGQLTRDERGYVTFAIFVCMGWNKSLDEVAYLTSRTELVIDTPSEIRAMFGYGNRLVASNDPQKLLHGITIYQKLSYQKKNKEIAEFSSFIIGVMYEHLSALATSQKKDKIAADFNKKALEHYRKLLKNKSAEPYRTSIDNAVLRIERQSM
jgi:hypothetical protein